MTLAFGCTVRFLPRLFAPRVARCPWSRNGVWIAPQASTTAGARSSMTRSASRVTGSTARPHTHAAPLLHQQALHAHRREAACSSRQRAGHVAHQGGLLRPGRAPEHAVVRADAGLLVALVHRVPPPLAARALGHQAVVLA